MRPLILLSILFTGMLISLACRRDKDVTPSCEQLQAAIISDDREAAREAINTLINQLPARTHTAENLAKLADLIGRQCSSNGEVICFKCIKTLPEESEIRVTTTAGGQPVQRVIDIDDNAGGDMKFVNMHD